MHQTKPLDAAREHELLCLHDPSDSPSGSRDSGEPSSFEDPRDFARAGDSDEPASAGEEGAGLKDASARVGPVGLKGGLAFASPEAQEQRTAELLGMGAIVVFVPALTERVRGRLGEHIEERIERELAARGAPSPYLTEWAAMPDLAEGRIADQLFRSRTLGAAGIAVAMGSLRAIGSPALTPEDSQALRIFANVAQGGAPLALLLDDGDARLEGYAAPIALDALLGRGRVDDEGVSTLATDEREHRKRREEDDWRESEPGEVEREHRERREEDDWRESEPGEVDAAVARETRESISVELDHDEAGADEIAPARNEQAQPRQPEHRDGEHDEHPAHETAATVGVPEVGPADSWRAWALALSAARGPQSLATFERLFAESYMPLANAIARGLDDPRALRAHEEFRRGFERTYTDAFATFGATGRRPRLVMDAFDVAARQARLHNARTTHVLVVDSMRFDVGELVRDTLAVRAAGVASPIGESLLWSALPTTTFRQLETLARGVDALRAPAQEEGTDSLRGRTAEAVRRMRVGSRELYKLDVVPAAFAGLDPGHGSPSAHVVDALALVADRIAEAITKHLHALQARTLVLVIGDHGFCIDRRGRISHGGAMPEEVLVPCLSYLVGELH